MLIAILIFACGGQLLGCNCGGQPANDLQEDIDSSVAIFIGRITTINTKHTFFRFGQNGLGWKYINFDILKINKGVNLAQLKITLFDLQSNSSCEGIYRNKAVGDTVLVFADLLNEKMLGAHWCGRHTVFGSLSEEEQMFIDTTDWVDPRTKYEDVATAYSKLYGEPYTSKESIKQEQALFNRDIILYLSFMLNVMLLGYIGWRKMWKTR